MTLKWIKLKREIIFVGFCDICPYKIQIVLNVEKFRRVWKGCSVKLGNSFAQNSEPSGYEWIWNFQTFGRLSFCFLDRYIYIYICISLSLSLTFSCFLCWFKIWEYIPSTESDFYFYNVSCKLRNSSKIAFILPGKDTWNIILDWWIQNAS